MLVRHQLNQVGETQSEFLPYNLPALPAPRDLSVTPLAGGGADTATTFCVPLEGQWKEATQHIGVGAIGGNGGQFLPVAAGLFLCTVLQADSCLPLSSLGTQHKHLALQFM